MTVRYEGADVADTRIFTAEAGDTVGADTLDVPAVGFAYDEVFYLSGSKVELRRFFEEVLAAVERLPEPDQVTTAGRLRSLVESCSDAWHESFDVEDFLAETPERFVVVETGVSDGRTILTWHDSAGSAAQYVNCQECPEYWGYELVDLETGERSPAEFVAEFRPASRF